jgi:16S rRNA (cytosine1402-N4)-methyltransferase
MTPGTGVSAQDILRESSEAELARIFRDYGDERRSKRLAATVVRRRGQAELTTSDDLVNAIRAALGPRTGPSEFARLFQALRIAVNEELSGLETALPSFLESLVCGGMIAVVSYHSGEDRIVKRQFREWASACVCPPGLPVCNCRGVALGAVDPKKPIYPSEQEMADNPRARSAKLRVFRKADAS